MKTEKKIWLAFVLNFGFSVFEFFGGMFTGSVAILSDAVHDLGDAVSIGLSALLEKKSRQHADDKYSYGYLRFSVLGSLITTLILAVGSVVVICNAIDRIAQPVPIRYDGMILFAVVGLLVNLAAAFVTHGGRSMNQKAVNLHMLEDVLGWAVVLAGAVAMRLTDFALLDPLLSIGVAVYILLHAGRNLRDILDLFLQRTPREIQVAHLRQHLMALPDVRDVHHIHIWSIDGENHCATMHIVADVPTVKEAVRVELAEHGIVHSVLELEVPGEVCAAPHCHIHPREDTGHCHHHH